jgi:Putative transposase
LLELRDGMVSFRWKDYAHGNKKCKMTISAEEFLRRFLLHTLPRGFVRIRCFGFLANRARAALLPLCQQLLELTPQPHTQTAAAADSGHPCLWRCPQCGGQREIHGSTDPT